MAEKAENKNILKLTKTYEFEGKKISELNLDLSSISVEDMEMTERLLVTTGKANPANILPEYSIPYLMQIASIATRLPIEFFNGLNYKDAMNIKMRIMAFSDTSD